MHNTLSQLTSYWLRLSWIPGKSPAFWLSLLAHFNLSVDELFKLSGKELCQCGLTVQEAMQILHADDALERVGQWLNKSADHHVMSISDERYPVRLQQLDSPPLVLFCVGPPERLSAPQISIVGSRKATLNGLNTARRFGRELGDAGITVTSGLALGIDGAAHQGACATKGRTIAILGGGLQQIYPRSHHQLATNIVANGGCLLSEFMPWEAARAYHFPRRNRLIAALSHGVLLIEAKIKSGSMITASLAADMGTDVFATPGNINNPLSEGPHYLIQQGARLTTCVDDILQELGWLSLSAANDKQPNLAQTDHDPLLRELGAEAVTIDYLASKTGMSVSTVMLKLVEMEIDGLVIAMPGGYQLA